MNTMLINQSNALENIQKLMKLISKGEEFEVKKIKKDDDFKINLEKSYKQALKDYKEGNFIFGGKV